MLSDARISRVQALATEQAETEFEGMLLVALDDLLAEREELLAELAKPCYMRIDKAEKRPDLVFPPEYYEEGAP